jgi:hypothetical protein
MIPRTSGISCSLMQLCKVPGNLLPHCRRLQYLFKETNPPRAFPEPSLCLGSSVTAGLPGLLQPYQGGTHGAVKLICKLPQVFAQVKENEDQGRDLFLVPMGHADEGRAWCCLFSELRHSQAPLWLTHTPSVTPHKGVPMSTLVCSFKLRAGKGTAKSSQEVGIVISTELVLTMKTRSAVPAESYVLFLGCLAIQWA